jgi:RNA 2',3'-cyclic 3'-phosphodiesterase
MSAPLDLREHSRRLFFAYWPDASTRMSLIEATRAAVASIDGQPVTAANLHVTLAFIGRVPGSRIPEIIRIGALGDYKPATLKFDRLEYWPRPKVVSVLAVSIPDVGQKLVDTLWERLLPLGLEREERPWRPHFTIVRRVRRPPPKLAIPAIEWACDRLALIESVSGPDGLHYTPLAEWPLGKS